MLRPWNAAALPEIMAGAVEESKLDVPVPFHEGRAVGQQQSTAGARGSGTAKARARPNVEVNRRAEGTSELNRRLGDVEKGAVALERCGVAGDYGWGCAGKQARCAGRLSGRGAAGQQPGGAAGARGGETAEARARPNVEVNRRAEGTSELNRRLGDGEKGNWALERYGVAGNYGRGLAGKQARCACSVSRRPSSRPANGAECLRRAQMTKQQASNQAAPPESEGVECGSQSEA